MSYLTSQLRDDLSEAIINTVGYPQSIRKVFLSEVYQPFRIVMDMDLTNERVQLDLDINRLDNTPRLMDGTIPFSAWLRQAARYVRPFPAAAEIVNRCIAMIETQTSKAAPSVPIHPPTITVAKKVMQEVAINGNDMLSYAWLEAGMNAGSGVGCLKVPRYDNGQPRMLPGGQAIYSGTGWLLTRNLIITNHHVIHARGENEPDASQADFRMQAVNTKVKFDYNAEEQTGVTVSVSALEAASLDLDYAILRLQAPVDRVPPVRKPVVIPVDQGETEAVNIIQHPGGNSKKVAIRNNHIYESVWPKVLYFTDTERGSSGSPVFNDKWEVVALHRASQAVDAFYQGKTTEWVNEGVQIKAIFDDLAANAPALSAEILTATGAGN